MKPIPTKIKRQISEDKFYKTCIHVGREDDSPCKGRITMEHAWIYAGKQINELWAIVPCCEKHNIGVSGRDKLWNKYVSLLRSPDNLDKYPKKNWEQEKVSLISEFKYEVPHCLLPF